MGIRQLLLAGAGAGAVNLKAYGVALTATGGGSVTFTMLSDGTTSGDAQGWFDPPTTGAGTGKWVILTSTSGTMTVSGTIGSRVQLSTNPSWTGTYAGGSVRTKTFTVQVYDAATGGNLLGSGTLSMEIDGS